MKQINEQYAISEGITANGQECTTLYKTHTKMQNDYYKRDKPEYIRSWYHADDVEGSSKVTQAQIDHEIMLNDWSRWNTVLEKETAPVEVSEYIYYSNLGALPPKVMRSGYFEVGEPHHHDNNGKAIHRAFWMDTEGKYWTGYPKQPQRDIFNEIADILRP